MLKSLSLSPQTHFQISSLLVVIIQVNIFNQIIYFFQFTCFISFLLYCLWGHHSRLDVSIVVRCVSIINNHDAFSCIHVLFSLQTSLLISQQEVCFQDTKPLSFTSDNLDFVNNKLVLSKVVNCCQPGACAVAAAIST